MEVELELAAGGAEAADRGRGGVGLEVAGELAEAEIGRAQEELGGEGAATLVEELVEDGHGEKGKFSVFTPSFRERWRTGQLSVFRPDLGTCRRSWLGSTFRECRRNWANR